MGKDCGYETFDPINIYAPSVAFEWPASHTSTNGPSVSTSSSAIINTIILIGGHGDGLMTVPYSTHLADRLPPSWRLVQPLLSSSYKAWGISGLEADTTQLTRFVRYIKELRPSGKVVMMGCSDGCQNSMHYLTSPTVESELERPLLDGAVLQGPVSERQYLGEGRIVGMNYEDFTIIAKDAVARGDPDEIMPTKAWRPFTLPISAQRWLDISICGGAHDMFGDDSTDEMLKGTFGVVGAKWVPLLILCSGDDEFVDKKCDQHQLLGRWAQAMKAGGGAMDEASTILEEATHRLLLHDPSPRIDAQVFEDFITRVVAFLGRVVEK